jgi:hypothetical protein
MLISLSVSADFDADADAEKMRVLISVMTSGGQSDFASFKSVLKSF